MKRILALLIICGVLAGPARAAFNDSDLSPRAAGQGDAFTAVDDDPAVVFYNPAGTAFLQRQELGLMYSQPFSGLDRVNFAREYFVYCMPVYRAGSFSAGWTSFQANDLYREDSFLLSFARDISSLLPGSMKDRAEKSLSAGINVKYLTHGFTTDNRTANDPVFSNGSTKGTFTGDAGLLFRRFLAARSLLNVGLSAKNLVPAEAGLKDTDRVPAETRFGLSWYTENWRAVNSFNVAADVVLRGSVYSVHGGGECWLTPEFGVRAGANPNEYAFGLSGIFILTGFDVRLDYSFLWPVHVESTSGSHLLALSLRL